MILIADSGSTKCDWVCIQSDGEEVLRTKTMGFNPYFHSSDEISNALAENPEIVGIKNDVSAVYFYGTGCSTKERNLIVQEALKVSFPMAKSTVNHDLLGAAYSAYDGEENITCILGTGSNSCMFDGKKLTQSVPSLGYILGDEGSGAFFGKKLLSAFLYNHLPIEISDDFTNSYGLETHEIITNIYVKPNANTYLASFAPFLTRHKSNPFIKSMLHNGMKEFLSVHVMSYPNALDLKMNFIGSIAFHFQDSIYSAAKELGLSIGNFIQAPVDGLVDYHKKYLL